MGKILIAYAKAFIIKKFTAYSPTGMKSYLTDFPALYTVFLRNDERGVTSALSSITARWSVIRKT
jgi:hypothetical protein